MPELTDDNEPEAAASAPHAHGADRKAVAPRATALTAEYPACRLRCLMPQTPGRMNYKVNANDSDHLSHKRLDAQSQHDRLGTREPSAHPPGQSRS